jgi:hypothetical protein
MQPYLEKNLVIDGKTITYKGIFRIDEVFLVLNTALEEKGYTLREKKNEEMVGENGRRAFFELRPYKVKTNYVTLMIKVRITFDKVTESIEVVNGVKQLYQNGEVNIVFDGWSLTDYQQRWTMKPWVYFVKGIIHKFIYKFPMEGGFIGELIGDTSYVYAKVRSFLNTYKIESGKFPSEESVRKEMEERIRVDMEEEIKRELEEEK